MNRISSLNRRQLLQGAGIALSLPAFESYAGGSANDDESPRRLVCVGNHLGFYTPSHTPFRIAVSSLLQHSAKAGFRIG